MAVPGLSSILTSIPLGGGLLKTETFPLPTKQSIAIEFTYACEIATSVY